MLTCISPGIRALKMALEASPAWLQSLYSVSRSDSGRACAALFAALIGIPVLRLKSDYLAIATLDFPRSYALRSPAPMDT